MGVEAGLHPLELAQGDVELGGAQVGGAQLAARAQQEVFGLDFAYLVPLLQRNPLENTLRFSIQFNFDKVQTK